jgi:hypothetical protein
LELRAGLPLSPRAAASAPVVDPPPHPTNQHGVAVDDVVSRAPCAQHTTRTPRRTRRTRPPTATCGCAFTFTASSLGSFARARVARLNSGFDRQADEPFRVPGPSPPTRSPANPRPRLGLRSDCPKVDSHVAHLSTMRPDICHYCHCWSDEAKGKREENEGGGTLIA